MTAQTYPVSRNANATISYLFNSLCALFYVTLLLEERCDASEISLSFTLSLSTSCCCSEVYWLCLCQFVKIRKNGKISIDFSPKFAKTVFSASSKLLFRYEWITRRVCSYTFTLDYANENSWCLSMSYGLLFIAQRYDICALRIIWSVFRARVRWV